MKPRLAIASAAALLALTLASCSSSEPSPTRAVDSTPAVAPAGFEFDDLYEPDMWVTDPVHGGTDCGDGLLHDCWTVNVMSETGCDDSFALLTIVERNRSGDELETYQTTAPAATAGRVSGFSFDSRFYGEQVIDEVEVIGAECTDLL
jgi:hypothetical protein